MVSHSRALSLVIAGSGSGDKTFDWVAAFSVLAIALLATLAWTLIDRRRAEYRSLLASNGFRVVAHVVDDVYAGGHTFWVAQADV